MPSNFCIGIGMGAVPSGWPRPGGGGGGDAPAWVRSGATADIDFVNDPPRAWDGATEIAWEDFDTILGTGVLDPTYEFNPAHLDSGVGYGIDNDTQGRAMFIGSMIDAWNFDFTVCLEFADNFQLEYTEATFGTDLVFTAGTIAPQTMSVADNGADSTGDILEREGSGPADTSSIWAVTVTAASIYSGYNGDPLYLFGDSMSGTSFDPSTPNQPTEIRFSAAKLRRVTIYPAKNEADTLALTA